MPSGELLLVTGPPAVGKMTVGRAVCARSGFRLFHNHHTIEPLMEIFGHGTPAFEELTLEFRQRVVEVAATHGLRLVFTYVWAVDAQDDADAVLSLMAPYADRGLPVSFVELTADLPTRLVRNAQPDRTRAKPSKQDLVWSDAHVREMELRHRMNTVPGEDSPAAAVIGDHPHLRLRNDDLSADEVAVRVLAWLRARDA